MYSLILIIILIIIICYNFINIDSFVNWVKSKSSTVKKYYIIDDKIYKEYPNKKNLENIEILYNKYLINLDFVPRMNFDYKNKIIIEDYYKELLTKNNKPSNYIKQLKNIDNTIRKLNLYYNDYKYQHFFVKKNKIYLIDWNTASKKKRKGLWICNNIDKIIKKLKT